MNQVNFQVRLEKQLHKDLRELSYAMDKSMNQIIIECLQKHMDNRKKLLTRK